MATADAFSDALENEILDVFFKEDAASAFSAGRWLALYTSNVTEAQSAETNEVTGTGYARIAITYGSAASGGAISNTAQIQFTGGAGGWDTATAMAIVDTTSGVGVVLAYENNISDVTLAESDTLTIAVGDLTVTVT